MGLTDAEATRRRAAGQGNDAPVATGRTYGRIIRDNVFNFINNILFALAIVLIALSHYLDALLSVGVVAANTVISLYQEVRAKRTLDRIAILTKPRAVVLRDGRERDVDPAELVVGDAVRAQPGDQIVVDGRVVGPGYLELDESLLTGEADLVVKRAGDAVLSGSFCVAGDGWYEAETVGAASFANQVTATAQSHRRSLTPLQHQANVLVWVLLVDRARLRGPGRLSVLHPASAVRRERPGDDRDRRSRAQQPDPRHRAGLRPGRRAHGRQGGAHPGGQRRRVAVERRRALHRQDRHPHDQRHPFARARSARSDAPRA